MPIHTFSTPTKRPSDEEAVQKLKEFCRQRRINFSAVIVDLIKKYEQEVIDGNKRPG